MGQGLVNCDPVLGANGTVWKDGGLVFVVTTQVAEVKCWEALKPDFMAEFQKKFWEEE